MSDPSLPRPLYLHPKPTTHEKLVARFERVGNSIDRLQSYVVAAAGIITEVVKDESVRERLRHRVTVVVDPVVELARDLFESVCEVIEEDI